jgi:hypothetical protein
VYKTRMSKQADNVEHCTLFIFTHRQSRSSVGRAPGFIIRKSRIQISVRRPGIVIEVSHDFSQSVSHISSNYITTASSHILSNQLFTNNTIIQSYIVRTSA